MKKMMADIVIGTKVTAKLRMIIIIIIIIIHGCVDIVNMNTVIMDYMGRRDNIDTQTILMLLTHMIVVFIRILSRTTQQPQYLHFAKNSSHNFDAYLGMCSGTDTSPRTHLGR